MVGRVYQITQRYHIRVIIITGIYITKNAKKNHVINSYIWNLFNFLKAFLNLFTQYDEVDIVNFIIIFVKNFHIFSCISSLNVNHFATWDDFSSHIHLLISTIHNISQTVGILSNKILQIVINQTQANQANADKASISMRINNINWSIPQTFELENISTIGKSNQGIIAIIKAILNSLRWKSSFLEEINFLDSIFQLFQT